MPVDAAEHIDFGVNLGLAELLGERGVRSSQENVMAAEDAAEDGEDDPEPRQTLVVEIETEIEGSKVTGRGTNVQPSKQQAANASIKSEVLKTLDKKVTFVGGTRS